MGSITPASADPTAQTPDVVPALKVIAFGSTSTGTTSGMIAGHVGSTNAMPTPLPIMRVISTSGVRAALLYRRATVAEITTIAIAAIIRSNRRSNLSAITPAKGATNGTGRSVDAVTRPTHSGEPVISNAVHPAAML
jgi:hypothetical protein